MTNLLTRYMWLLALTWLVAGRAQAEYREWTSDVGKTMVAEIVTADETNVTLKRKSDGRHMTIPLDRLTEVDRRYVNVYMYGVTDEEGKEDLYYVPSIHDPKPVIKTPVITDHGEAFGTDPFADDRRVDDARTSAASTTKRSTGMVDPALTLTLLTLFFVFVWQPISLTIGFRGCGESGMTYPHALVMGVVLMVSGAIGMGAQKMMMDSAGMAGPGAAEFSGLVFVRFLFNCIIPLATVCVMGSVGICKAFRIMTVTGVLNGVIVALILLSLWHLAPEHGQYIIDTLVPTGPEVVPG